MPETTELFERVIVSRLRQECFYYMILSLSIDYELDFNLTNYREILHKGYACIFPVSNRTRRLPLYSKCNDIVGTKSRKK